MPYYRVQGLSDTREWYDTHWGCGRGRNGVEDTLPFLDEDRANTAIADARRGWGEEKYRLVEVNVEDAPTGYCVQKCRRDNGAWDNTFWGASATVPPNYNKALLLDLPTANDAMMDAVEASHPSTANYVRFVSAWRVVKVRDLGSHDEILEVVREVPL